MRLLTVRARSCHEIRDRLIGAGFTEPAVEAVQGRLLNAGLLDDAAFAGHLARRGVESGRSSQLTRRNLMASGIDHETVEATLSMIAEPGADEDRALSLAERKAASYRNVPADKAIARVVRHLGSKGYEPQLAWEVARRVFRDTDIPSD